MTICVKFLSQIARPEKKTEKNMKFSFSSMLFLFLMSQASYNLVTSVPAAAMTSSVIDAMLILACMLEYYQIAFNAPFTSYAIERKQLRLLTDLLVTNCRVLMERLVDRR